MRGAEAPDLIQFDVGVVRVRHGGAGNPPVGAGHPGGRISPGSGLPVQPSAARSRGNLAMGRLPQPDKVSLLAEHNGVVPPPDHRFSAVRCDRDSYQVAGRYPYRPRRREGLRIRNSGQLPLLRIWQVSS